jgi:hypothetical protein
VIDEWNEDQSGFARFSDDRKMRYLLARDLTGTRPSQAIRDRQARRVVFVMLNPSTADAFKLDPTVRRCVEFAKRWGGDVLEVVNLYAKRSPYPRDVRDAYGGDRGIDEIATHEIVTACVGASRVIAAWGSNAAMIDGGNRAAQIRELLWRDDVGLEHFGLTGDGYPLHPLARGKSFIPYDRKPEVWT